jgi:rsbT co-antagonist protein RsbR
MANPHEGRVLQVVEQSKIQLLAEWIKTLRASAPRGAVIADAELQAQCQEFLALLRDGIHAGGLESDLQATVWRAMRDLLVGVSRSRTHQGFTPSETASFVFSLKEPIIRHLREVHDGDASSALLDDVVRVTSLLDHLGLFTTEVHQKAREEVILRQREEMLELSTPVIQLWDGILALPIIGTLDSARTQTVMESLLQQVVATRSSIAILDITGVPTVDTLTAQHLLKTVAAARLMGAECIISGIRPQIAQTIVHLGVDLSAVTTKASLADAFRLALRRLGKGVEVTAELLPAERNGHRGAAAPAPAYANGREG